jgi:hypothetical protein
MPDHGALMSISLALVPSDVARVTATVTGPGISPPIVGPLALSGNPPTAAGTITDVPAGSNVTVTVQGYAAAPEQNVVIYRGSAITSVPAGGVVNVSITLQPVNANVAVTATFPTGDTDVALVNHTAVVVTGARLEQPVTYYLRLNAAALQATGTAQAIPVGAERTFAVSAYSASGQLLFSGSATAPVVEGSNAVTVALTNQTGVGTVTINGGFCTPDCTGIVCGSDGCNGSCGGCEPGDSCAAGVCQSSGPILIATANPSGLAIDANSIYWGDRGADSSNSHILKAPIGGGAISTLAGGQNEVWQLAADGENVYWVDRAGGSIQQVPASGGSVITVASGQVNPWGIAVDASSVFWVAGDSYGATVVSAPIGGGQLVTLASNQADPIDIATDGVNVYWDSYFDGSVVQIPVSGGTPLTIAGSDGSAYGLTTDGSNVYWIGGQTLCQIPVGGGAVVTISADIDAPQYVAVSKGQIYLTTESGYVLSAPIGGGMIATLFSTGGNIANDIAVDANNVYFDWFGMPGEVVQLPLQ